MIVAQQEPKLQKFTSVPLTERHRYPSLSPTTSIADSSIMFYSGIQIPIQLPFSHYTKTSIWSLGRDQRRGRFSFNMVNRNIGWLVRSMEELE